MSSVFSSAPLEMAEDSFHQQPNRVTGLGESSSINGNLEIQCAGRRMGWDEGEVLAEVKGTFPDRLWTGHQTASYLTGLGERRVAATSL